MKTFEIEIFKGHAIIRDANNIILVDTGAPNTVNQTDSFIFLNKEYNTTTNYMGLTVQKLSELLGMEITTLLGADILSEYKIVFDYKNHQISFSENEIDFEGEEVSLTSFMGIPIITLEVENKPINCFLDTGAQLSYLPSSITSHYQSSGVKEDFYPGVGKFNTECFQIDTTIGKESFEVKYGNLPEILQMTLMMADTQGIIGYDFFANFKVMLDLQNNIVKYSV
jgi:hypothetical protein